MEGLSQVFQFGNSTQKDFKGFSFSVPLKSNINNNNNNKDYQQGNFSDFQLKSFKPSVPLAHKKAIGTKKLFDFEANKENFDPITRSFTNLIRKDKAAASKCKCMPLQDITYKLISDANTTPSSLVNLGWSDMFGQQLFEEDTRLSKRTRRSETSADRNAFVTFAPGVKSVQIQDKPQAVVEKPKSRLRMFR